VHKWRKRKKRGFPMCSNPLKVFLSFVHVLKHLNIEHGLTCVGSIITICIIIMYKTKLLSLLKNNFCQCTCRVSSRRAVNHCFRKRRELSTTSVILRLDQTKIGKMEKENSNQFLNKSFKGIQSFLTKRYMIQNYFQ